MIVTPLSDGIKTLLVGHNEDDIRGNAGAWEGGDQCVGEAESGGSQGGLFEESATV